MNRYKLHKGMLVSARQNIELYNFNPIYNRLHSFDELVPIHTHDVLMLLSFQFNKKRIKALPEAHIHPERSLNVYSFLHGEEIIYQEFNFEHDFFNFWRVVKL